MNDYRYESLVFRSEIIILIAECRTAAVGHGKEHSCRALEDDKDWCLYGYCCERVIADDIIKIQRA